GVALQHAERLEAHRRGGGGVALGNDQAGLGVVGGVGRDAGHGLVGGQPRVGRVGHVGGIGADGDGGRVGARAVRHDAIGSAGSGDGHGGIDEVYVGAILDAIAIEVDEGVALQHAERLEAHRRGGGGVALGNDQAGLGVVGGVGRDAGHGLVG